MGRRLCAYCFDLEVLLASPPEALRGYYRHCAAVDGFLPLEDETVIRDFAAVNKNDFARYITGDKEERI